MIPKSCLLIPFVFLNGIFLSLSLDSNGYIVYCPCMGRFGNQAEQLLGTMQFGKAVNRTIVLPPFIHYVDRDVHFIPFTDYIDIHPIRKYHSFITLDEFTSVIAPQLWQGNQRRIFCYSKRPGPRNEDCNPMDGSPHGPFWREAVGVDHFAESVFYSPLTHSHHHARDWINQYQKYPVIAFVGAPSAFPTNAQAVELQKYVRFSAMAKLKAQNYKEIRKFPLTPYISVHLRHGSDWQNACQILRDHPTSEFFSSQQCLTTESSLPYEICFQSRSQIIHDILQVVTSSNVSTVYVATDSDDYDLWQHLYKKLARQVPDIRLLTPTQTYSAAYPDGYYAGRQPSIIEDLVVLSESDHFIGNCISSFSAFVSRSRKWSGKESSFFAWNRIPKRETDHDEL